jgi:hypothetical protein
VQDLHAGGPAFDFAGATETADAPSFALFAKVGAMPHAALVLTKGSAGGPAFDFAGATETVGAPSFALFAKGGCDAACCSGFD